MVELQDLVPFVRQHVPRCPDFTIRFFLLQAARSFCRRTRFVRETIVVESVAEQAYYPLTPETPCHEVIEVKAVSYDGDRIPSASPEEVSPDTEGVRCWFFVPPAAVNLVGAPHSVADIEVSAILQPEDRALVITEALARSNDQALYDGALSFILRQAGTSWFDPVQAEARARAFESAMGNAQYRADSQHRPYGFRVASHP